MLNSFPPQAYTRDALAQAFEWLKGQPAAVKDLASNADTLVGLYLQARRRTQVSGPSSAPSGTMENSAPVSSQAFKHDLKTLARDLKQFEVNPLATLETAEPVGAFDSSIEFVAPLAKESVNPAPFVRETPPPERTYVRPEPPPQERVYARPDAPAQERIYSRPEAPLPSTHWLDGLDLKSVQTLREIQSRLNLSSEVEALRMLISIGADRLRRMLL